MTTFKRICLDDHELVDGDKSLTLVRGKEYTTSAEKDGNVRLFSAYWVTVPVEWFAGEKRFT